eukprot:1176931-Prorocentrum_minimum.AAC.3
MSRCTRPRATATPARGSAKAPMMVSRKVTPLQTGDGAAADGSGAESDSDLEAVALSSPESVSNSPLPAISI